MSRLKFSRLSLGILIAAWACSNQDLGISSSKVQQLVIDVAQTSGQLASGTSFAISGSSTDSTMDQPPHGGPGPKGHGKPGGPHPGILDGLNLLAPTNDLLAIVDAESASDLRGLRMSKNGGATITNYDANGAVVNVPLPGKDGPQGCSFSGKQFPEYDALLSSIVKTEIDFGSGVTFKRDTVEITRAGKIIITRSTSGGTVTETTTFDNYSVNGAKIAGTKTRVSTLDTTTGKGTSTTTVTGGSITFADGTVATWTSDRSRVSDITVDDHGRPESGTITTEVNTQVTANGTVIYSHKTTTPLIENLACEGRRRGPVSGVVETIYKSDNISVDYGDGTCTNRTVTITFNGTTTSKTIGG